jgi:hypothetical protein
MKGQVEHIYNYVLVSDSYWDDKAYGIKRV